MKALNKLAKKDKNNIRITVGRHSGFCFGVKRAYDLALANSKDRKNVFILGKLVHNSDVCYDLKKKGIREIKSIDAFKKGTVIFTAHGVGPNIYKEAKARRLKIVDTTCPKVIKVQRLAKSYVEKGWQVIIFGDKKHKEIKGIKEWSENQGHIIGSLKEAKKIKLNKKKYCLISQTTQNVGEFEKIKEYLNKQLPNFVFFNTICDSTLNRQNEIRELAKNNNIVLVIGGIDSANSKRLYEISKAINTKSYFIENASQTKKNWFNNIKNVAVTAGASTPEKVIKEVTNWISNLA
jgi:(E)-4-hydroxy-3-methyl-but-2-enyl pyrophosphate reductase